MNLVTIACFVLFLASEAVTGSTIRHQNVIEYMRSNNRDIDESLLEDATLSTLQLVAKYGYKGEQHTVQTADGYVLNIHRVYPGAGCGEKDKVPILLQHGLLSSSADWVVMGPNKGFAYILADNCYDVWMGNSRGNTNSRNHTRLDPNSDEYWDFSWHEMGLYDIPTVIDYILARTGQKQLYYIGHSQGTTQYFIMNSLKPEYGEKVKAMFALAPIAFMGHCHSTILTFIAKFASVIGWVADTLGINQLLPTTQFVSDVGGQLCNDEHPNSQNVCSNLLFAICGYDEPQTNKTMLPVILGHTPAGSSTKQFLHYAQLMNAGKFQMFDYGTKGNNEKYGQKTPPEYPLDQAKSPIALFYSNNDYFASPEDVDILYTKLGNPLGKFLIPWDAFNHLDHMWAIDAKTLVYDKVIDIMNRF